jgi:hypothetical protein
MSIFVPSCASIELERVVDHRQRAQSEKVHLEKTHLLDDAHVVLRDDFVLVRAEERDVVADRLGCDDDARGVHPGVAREPLEFLADLDDPLDFLVVPDGVGKHGRDLRGLLKRDRPGPPGIAFAILSTNAKLCPSTRPTSRTTDRAAIVPNVMICATFSSPYLCLDVLDDLAAPPHAEVDVDVWHRDPLRVQEALEQEIVLERVDVVIPSPRPRATPRPIRGPGPTGIPRSFARMKSQTTRK